MKVDGKRRWQKIVPVNTRVWPVLCVLVAVGCRTNDPMTEEKFCQEYARIECDKIADFCTFDPARCEPIRIDVCRMAAARLKGGGHQFNPDNTDQCLKKLDESFQRLPITAAKLQEVDVACSRVFAGVGKVTDPCTVDFDCANGLICDKGHCGTAKVVPSRSGCANIGERCPTEEYCTNENPNMLYMCLPRMTEGAPCSLSRPCATGLRCLNTCVKKLPIASACAGDEDCETDYCTEFVPDPTCGVGLSFATGSPSCLAFMSADAGTPVRGPNEVADAGTD